jgi:hypothetical protein
MISPAMIDSEGQERRKIQWPCFVRVRQRKASGGGPVVTFDDMLQNAQNDDCFHRGNL